MTAKAPRTTVTVNATEGRDRMILRAKKRALKTCDASTATKKATSNVTARKVGRMTDVTRGGDVGARPGAAATPGIGKTEGVPQGEDQEAGATAVTTGGGEGLIQVTVIGSTEEVGLTTDATIVKGVGLRRGATAEIVATDAALIDAVMTVTDVTPDVTAVTTTVVEMTAGGMTVTVAGARSGGNVDASAGPTGDSRDEARDVTMRTRMASHSQKISKRSESLMVQKVPTTTRNARIARRENRATTTSVTTKRLAKISRSSSPRTITTWTEGTEAE